jgi:hypothetical protein
MNCITSLVFTDPAIITPGPSGGLSLTFDVITNLANANGCRYNINRATKEITDTLTNTVYDCFSPAQGGDITVSNNLVAVPIFPLTVTQCMIFSGIPCGLDPAGICWEVTLVPTATPGIYQPTYLNTKFCSGATAVVDSATLAACLTCNSFNFV